MSTKNALLKAGVPNLKYLRMRKVENSNSMISFGNMFPHGVGSSRRIPATANNISLLTSEKIRKKKKKKIFNFEKSEYLNNKKIFS